MFNLGGFELTPSKIDVCICDKSYCALLAFGRSSMQHNAIPGHLLITSSILLQSPLAARSRTQFGNIIQHRLSLGFVICRFLSSDSVVILFTRFMPMPRDAVVHTLAILARSTPHEVVVRLALVQLAVATPWRKAPGETWQLCERCLSCKTIVHGEGLPRSCTLDIFVRQGL